MPGTCGELVQGTLAGTPFHVSCPIDIYSTVEVGLEIGGQGIDHLHGLEKATEALRRLLARHASYPYGGYLKITSSLPRAKGMASSTADVAGALFAGALALGLEIAPGEIAEIALSIEPTDGSLFEDVVLFDHREGKLFRNLGPAPLLDILVLDTGGEVDTIAFNMVDRKEKLLSLEPQIAEALRLVEFGIQNNNPDLVAKGATLSAMLNQDILYKPEMVSILDLTLELGGLGICAGHSGTVIGALFPRGEQEHKYLLEPFAAVPGVEVLTFCSMVGGGARQIVGELR